MKSILISIKPKWCIKIASGEKTIEIRKTMPNLGTPFKCYIYASSDGDKKLWRNGNELWIDRYPFYNTYGVLSGKIIGEFVCKNIDIHAKLPKGYEEYTEEYILEGTGLTTQELYKYLGNSPFYYRWYISDLVMYDKPKELCEFYKMCPKYNGNSWKLIGCIVDCEHRCEGDGKTFITKPPQSWMYVEDIDNG